VTVLRVVGNGVVAGVATMDGGRAAELELHALDKQGHEEHLRVDVSDVPKLSNESAGTTRLSGGSSEEIGAALLATARERGAEFVEITSIPQTSGRAFFVVFLTRRSLFREDNFEIVELIARYAAQVFDLRYLLARERRLSEDLEIAMVQADAANRAKTDFLANMSHELRTPLNSIIGFSEILAGASFGPLNAKQAKYVDNILGSGRHLLSLINDILDLSKIEAGKMVLAATSFDLLPSVNEVAATVEPLATKKTITLNVSAETDIPPIYADSGKIRQVLYNLLSNAIKFTLPGGEVRVVMRHWGGAQENGDAATVPIVEIRVRDSGIGIKKGDIHRVFGKFEQLDSSYARKQEGTGLGLALTRRLIEMHGGTVTVASEGEGKGSEFTVRLPVRPTRTEAETAHTLELLARINADNGEKPLVLVIEDDPRAQELITYYLDRAGFAYEITSDAGQALDIAMTRKPVAITLDILLPDTNGWEVLRQLKARAETSPIPVFVISVTHDRELGLSLGAREFFVKPISGRELVDGIHEAMKERASITIPPTGEHEVPNT
jgi:signal transduction histidine kinase/ActR/RegA family two-component response regulator